MKEREILPKINDWLIELLDNKLSEKNPYDNHLASELGENKSFLSQLQSRK